MRLTSAVSPSISLIQRTRLVRRASYHLASLSPLVVGLALGCGETDNGAATNPTATATSTTVVPQTPPPVTPTTPATVTPPPTGVTPTPTNPAPVTPVTPVTPPVTPPTPPTGVVTPPTPPTTPPSTSDTSTPPASTTEPVPTSDGESSDTGEPPAPVGVCPANPGTAPSGNLTAKLAAAASTNGPYYLFEGPVWIDGALYFSQVNPADGWNSDIHKYVPGVEGVTDFLLQAGTNGLAVDSQGVLFSATSKKKEISKYNLSTAAQTTAVSGMFNSPNDIAIAQDGTIYFSDQQQGELPAGGKPPAVHQVRNGQDSLFAQDVQPANGVLTSPDDSIVYISITGNRVVKAVPVMNDGTAGTATDFAADLESPDGLTKDCLGNIYIAEHGAQRVSVWSPAGMKIATIGLSDPNSQAQNTTNVAFGGADGKTLFITAAYSLWEIELPVAGYPY